MVEAEQKPKTDLELADELFRRRITDYGDRLVVLVYFGDLPDQVLIYVQSRDVRSMEVLNEQRAMETVAAYEEIARNSRGVHEEHLLTITTRQEFVPVARGAIIKSRADEFPEAEELNINYLCGVLDGLLTTPNSSQT